jgi:hypothetical protein
MKRIVVISMFCCKKPLKLTGRQIGVRRELFVIGFQQTVESTEMCCLVQDKTESSYHTSLNAMDIWHSTLHPVIAQYHCRACYNFVRTQITVSTVQL